jgi:hypothetical protein
VVSPAAATGSISGGVESGAIRVPRRLRWRRPVWAGWRLRARGSWRRRGTARGERRWYVASLRTADVTANSAQPPSAITPASAYGPPVRFGCVFPVTPPSFQGKAQPTQRPSLSANTPGGTWLSRSRPLTEASVSPLPA